jgi:TonB-linked SusC/RagA family outer membrane protein
MQQGIPGIYPTVFWGDIYIGDHNRFDQLFGTSYGQQHNLSISGASEKSEYRFSAGFADNQTALKTAYDGQKQYSIRLNYDYDITDRITLESGMVYQKSIVSGPSTGLGTEAGSHDPPFFPAKTPSGEWYANFNIAGNRNSVASTTDGGREDFVEDLIKTNFGININILEGLDFKATGSYNKRVSREDLYRLTVQPHRWTGGPSSERINGTPIIAVRNFDRSYENYSATLNYIKSFRKHNFRIMAGLTADYQKDKNLYAERRGIENLGVYDLNVAPVDGQRLTGGQSHWGLYSQISRLNYDYDGKYLVELIGRRDASSRFDPDNRWANYGSVSLGWVLSRERFFQDLDWLSFLKLRGGYGEVGNFTGIGLYDYVSTISNGTALFGTSPSLQTTSRVSGITSSLRTWERVKISNAGIDFNLLEGKISGSFDYFIKRNDGMLIEVGYSSVLGGEAPPSNSGVLETKGWEATLGWNSKIGEVGYNISFNISDSQNEITKYEGTSIPEPGLNDPLEDYPLNSYFLYQTDGLFANQAEVDAYYNQFTQTINGIIPYRDSEADPDVLAASELRPGDTRKIDVEKDGDIDQYDIVFFGDAAPHYVFGLQMGATWKGFDFNAFFQGVLDQNVIRTGWLQYPFFQVWTNQTTAYMGKTWTESTADAVYPRMTNNTIRSQYNWQNNDFMLQNNRYIRLKTLIIGYSLPGPLIEKARIDRVRIFFSGNDLFELTSLKDGYDPEFGESTQTIYPFSRTWSLGINLTF